MSSYLFNKALRILLFTNALILVAIAMLGPVYAIFVEQIGGDLLDASMTGAIFAFTAGLTSLIAGKYADRIKENELILVIGYSIIGIGFICYTFVDNISKLFFVQIIMGIGEAIYSPAFDALYSKHLTKKRAGRQWGAWEAMYYFVTAFGAMLGGLLIYSFGFNFIFILMALLSFTSAFYIYFLPRKIL